MWISGSTHGLASPTSGRLIWGGQRPVWITDSSDEADLRVVSDEATGCRLAVAGECYATNSELNTGLAALTRGDWRALTSWPGSYWVICDDRTRTTVVTDVAGSKPVYYARYGRGTVWATQATPLADLTSATFDFPAIAARMTCPTVSEVCGSATAFTGIQRLPGGHALQAEDGIVQIRRYEPLDEQQPFEQAALALRKTLVSAVEARAAAAKQLSADFSGGLDSTSLALLAVRAGHPLLAVTRDDPTSGNDDPRYARQLAAGQPLITHLVVRDDGGLFFDGMDQAPLTDQPFTDAIRWAMRRSYQSQVLNYGSDLHLTGAGGDTLLAASPSYLADLVSARPEQVRILVLHATNRARLRHLPVRTVLGSAIALAHTSYSQALRSLAVEITDPPPRWERTAATRRLRWCGTAGFAAWLTPETREQLADHVRTVADHVELGGLPVSRHRAWSELREFGAYQAELTAQTRAGGVNAHAPMLDNGVVRAAMSIPVHQRQSVVVQKPLLGAALDGLVPQLLLKRTTKGAYDGNAYAGTRANAARLRAMIRESQLVAVGVIDPVPVLAELDRLIAGAPGRLANLETLVTTDLWLTQQAARASATWRNKENAHV